MPNWVDGKRAVPRCSKSAATESSSIPAWKGVTTTISFYLGVAKTGHDSEAILKGLHALIDEATYRNFVIDRRGGGIETCSMVTATINEMLIQSHQGVICILPNWPKEQDSRFNKLCAYGAARVPSEQKGGSVQNVRIVSERGQPCALRNPWPGEKIQLTRNGNPTEPLVGDLVKLDPGSGETFELRQE